MALSFSYVARNLLVRKLTTAFTALGMALVVFVFATVLMMAEGLRATLVGTGAPDNVLVIGRGSQTEVQSTLARDQAAIIESVAAIASDADGAKLVSKEPLVLLNLEKRGSANLANVVARGVTANGLRLRPQANIIAGRMFRPGTSEIVVGQAIASGFKNAGLGEALHFAMQNWRVVGVFDAGHSGFDSEIWGDAEQMMQLFRRNAFSSVLFRLIDSEKFARVKEQLEADPRLNVAVSAETQFYADQSEQMAKFIRVLGTAITLIFSVGAIIGAAITMYASVANRTGEIGTLRALGFTRRSILQAFLLEAMLLGGLGGVVGLFAASFMRFVHVSTTNLQTFAEIAFSFRLSPAIAGYVVLFAILMGLLGGFLPATRAARLNIVDALRAD
ncbi:MAG TPA: ABC transporter permease [Spongiibacteraceae bacterium]|jgi:ABC-type lipoprotein release transport system permease subunit